ncbi:ABC-2 transporter permease [Huintestinicola sp.]|uniref:ABC-2 transporter permease n=1 Tax=Huintestinicola sp. TaxID=2981661 RepID=UPI003D7E9782
MSGLIFKEFYQNRKLLWFIFFPFLLIPGIVSEAARGTSANSIMMSVMLYEVIIIFYGYMVTAEMMKYDERKAWAAFIISTPQAARGQVASKYGFSLIVLVGSVFVSYIYDVIACAAADLDFSALPFISNLFFLLILMLSVEIPFSIRFGSVNGNKYRAMIVILLLFAGMVYLLFGDLSIFGEPEKLIDSLIKLVKGEGIPDALLIIMGIFPYFSIVMFCLSYKLSCRLYIKGIESFEK